MEVVVKHCGCSLETRALRRTVTEYFASETVEEMKNCVWLEPELVAQIKFTEWTPHGHLRHASFSGLRTDKRAQEVVRESA
jgi:bifunctional non-homologous end joining protein LigD